MPWVDAALLVSGAIDFFTDGALSEAAYSVWDALNGPSEFEEMLLNAQLNASMQQDLQFSSPIEHVRGYW